VYALRRVAGCDGVPAVAGVFLHEIWVHLEVVFMRSLRKVHGCYFVSQRGTELNLCVRDEVTYRMG
jgi:hypothetical protein